LKPKDANPRFATGKKKVLAIFVVNDSRMRSDQQEKPH